MAILTKAAASYAQVSGTWSNQTNAYSTTGDDQYASITLSTRNGTAEIRYGFGGTFTTDEIPDGSVINSVKVSAEVGLSNGTINSVIYVTLETPAGTAVGNVAQTGSTSDTLLESSTTSLTLTDLRTNSILCDILYDRANSSVSETCRIDYASVTVDYTPPAAKVYGQAQADIFATVNKFGQSQAKILALVTYNAFGQANALLPITASYGLANARIKWTSPSPNFPLSDGYLIGYDTFTRDGTGTVSLNGLEAQIPNHFWANSGSGFNLDKDNDYIRSVAQVGFTSSAQYSTLVSDTLVIYASLPATFGAYYGGPWAGSTSAGTPYQYGTTFSSDGLTINIIRTAQFASSVIIGSFVLSANTKRRVKFYSGSFKPTYLKVSVWNESENEPTSWDIETSDSTSTYQFLNKNFGISTFTTNNANITITNFKAISLSNFTAPFGQALATIKNYINTGQAFTEIMPSPVYYSAYDTFTRTTSNSWGTADVGGDWYGTDVDLSTDGSKGVISGGIDTRLPKTFFSIRDKNILYIKFKYNYSSLGTNNSISFGMGTLTSNIDSKITTLAISSSGVITLTIMLSGSGSGIGMGKTYVAGETWIYQGYMYIDDGFKIAGKTWKEGTSEPETYTVRSTDFGSQRMLQEGNSNFVISVIISSPTILTIDDLDVHHIYNVLGQSIAQIDGDYYQYYLTGQALAGILRSFSNHGQATALIHSTIIRGQAIARIIPSNPYFSVTDTFTRTIALSSGWGTSDNAGDWIPTNTNIGYGVDGSWGYYKGVSSYFMGLPNLVLDKNIFRWYTSFKFALDAITNTCWIHIKDSHVANSGLGLGIYINSTSGLINFSRISDSIYNNSTGKYYVVGETWNFRGYLERYATNFTIYCKVWKEGDTEPNTYTNFNQTYVNYYYTSPQYFAVQIDGIDSNNAVKIDDLNIYQWLQTFGQAQAQIEAGVQTYNSYGQSQGWIGQTYQTLAQAQAQIGAPTYIYGQAGTTINSSLIRVRRTYLANTDSSSTSINIPIGEIDPKSLLVVSFFADLSGGDPPTISGAGRTWYAATSSYLKDDAEARIYVTTWETDASSPTQVSLSWSNSNTDYIIQIWEVVNATSPVVSLGTSGYSDNPTYDSIVANIPNPRPYYNRVYIWVLGATVTDEIVTNFWSSLDIQQIQAGSALGIYYETYYDNYDMIIVDHLGEIELGAFQGIANGTEYAAAFIRLDEAPVRETGLAQAQIASGVTTNIFGQSQAQIKSSNYSYANTLAQIVRHKLTITPRGTGSNSSSSTSIDCSPTSNFTAGALAVLAIGYDNANGATDPFSTISDSLGNTWTSRKDLVRGSTTYTGTIIRVFTSQQEVGTLQTSSIVTISFGAINVVAKVYHFWEVTTTEAGTYPEYLGTNAGNSSNTDSPEVTTDTISVGDGIIAFSVHEVGTNATYTNDTDLTNGMWSNNQYIAVGLSTSGQNLHSQYKLQVVADSTQTYTVVRGSSSDWASVYISLTSKIHRGYAQANTQIATGIATYNSCGQTQTQIKQSYQVVAQAQAQIKTYYQSYAQANAWIEQTYRSYAQANAWIEVTYNAYANAQAQIKQSYQAYANALAYIKTSYLSYAQAMSLTEQSSVVLAQAQTWIKQTYAVVGQAGAWVEQAYAAVGQAQAASKAVGYGVGQSQTSIEQTYSRVANTQTHIKTYYLGFAQSQAQVLAAYSQVAQAQVQVVLSINIYNVYGQSLVQIKQTYQVLGQAQALIPGAVQVFAQAQTQVEQTYNSYAQSNAWIEQTYLGYANAQAWIKATYKVYAQAQAQIETSYWGIAQAQALILQSYFGSAQSQAQIEQAYQGYAQVLTWIEATYSVYAQAQAQIEVTSNGYAQAQALIESTYNVFAQAQAQVEITSYGYGQSQTQVMITVPVFAQAQAKLSAYGVQAYALAQGYLEGSYITFAQAQVNILASSYGLANAQASIIGPTQEVGQAAVLIYIPVYARPIADISNNGWVRTVKN